MLPRLTRTFASTARNPSPVSLCSTKLFCKNHRVITTKVKTTTRKGIVTNQTKLIRNKSSIHHVKDTTTPITATTATTSDSNCLNAPRIRGRNDDALSRYPHWKTPGGILRGLDYVGTWTFALTGSVTAAQSGLDVFGASIVAMVTAVGGGTIRDAVLLSKRPFWTSETEYIWMTVLTGMITFFTWPQVLEWQHERRQEKLRMKNQPSEGSLIPTPLATTSAIYNHGEDDDDTEASSIHVNNNTNRTFDACDEHLACYDELDATLDTLDAIGLSAFAIVGAQNGIRAGMPMVVSAICGMATSTFGGMTRDVLCGRPVRIIHSNAEIYAQPALLGAMTYLIAQKVLPTSPAARICSAFLVCMGTRYIAVTENVKMHTWDTQNDGLGVAIRK
mmetsp:Transcript_26723/g.55953  ORF Transcript_26723/g.55953 Transcript_26723/m.55953 type:complete len:390 (-) Transcript_26723:145-1314(-)